MPTIQEMAIFKRLTTGRPVKFRRVPRPKPPIAIELAYSRELRKMTDTAKEVLRQVLGPAIPALGREAGVNADAYPDTLNTLMALVRSSYTSLVSPQDVEALAQEYASKINLRNKRETLNMLSRAVSVDIFLGDALVPAELRAFVTQNVDLITSINEDYFKQVEQQLLTGLRAGTRVENLQTIIEDRWKVPAARAELIARDQVGKFNGQLSQLRQEEVGVTSYVWRTTGDERVRENHASKEGEVFKWSDPPNDTGHPGQDYQCRCTAEPIIRI